MTTTTRPNIEKLRAVYDTIAALEAERLERIAAGEKPPRRWNQAVWGTLAEVDPSHSEPESCGTSFCFAGWTAKLDDCEMDWTRAGESVSRAALESVRPPGTEAWVMVWDYATGALGLTEDQAGELFGASNSLAQIKIMIDAMEADPGISGTMLNWSATEVEAS